MFSWSIFRLFFACSLVMEQYYDQSSIRGVESPMGCPGSLADSGVEATKASKNGPHHTIYWVKQKKKDKTVPCHTATDASKQLYTIGTKYTGDWKNDKKTGFGTQTWAKGQKYEGEWVDNCRHGKGTFWVKRKGKLTKQYTGDWFEDKRTGKGICYYDDGSKYDGHWSENKRQGRGIQTFSDNSVYEGDWINDKRSGLGVLVTPDGNRYEGHWLNDLKEGPGRYYYADTNKVYEGEWHHDTAKCGIFRDATESNDDMNPDNFILPTLELKHPNSVLGEEVARLRQARSAMYGTESEKEQLVSFSNEDLSIIRAEFDSRDRSQRGMIRCADIVQIMAAIGLCPEENEVFSLLSQLDATHDTEISFAELIDIMALLLSEDNQ